MDLLFRLLMHSAVASCVCPDWGSDPQPWCIWTTLQSRGTRLGFACHSISCGFTHDLKHKQPLAKMPHGLCKHNFPRPPESLWGLDQVPALGHLLHFRVFTGIIECVHFGSVPASPGLSP